MSVEAILLGLAQDGGVPQAGCTCPTCQQAWQNPERMIHLNHSNPLLAEGPERRWLKEQGLGVGRPGERWQLG